MLNQHIRTQRTSTSFGSLSQGQLFRMSPTDPSLWVKAWLEFEGGVHVGALRINGLRRLLEPGVVVYPVELVDTDIEKAPLQSKSRAIRYKNLSIS